MRSNKYLQLEPVYIWNIFHNLKMSIFNVQKHFKLINSRKKNLNF